MENDILKDYLNINKGKVIDMEKLLFDQEYAFDMALRASRKEGIEIGQAHGIEIGRTQGIEIGQAYGIELATDMYLTKLSASLMEQDPGLTEDEALLRARTMLGL